MIQDGFLFYNPPAVTSSLSLQLQTFRLPEEGALDLLESIGASRPRRGVAAARLHRKPT